jgi:hypothetical protein
LRPRLQAPHRLTERTAIPEQQGGTGNQQPIGRQATSVQPAPVPHDFGGRFEQDKLFIFATGAGHNTSSDNK